MYLELFLLIFRLSLIVKLGLPTCMGLLVVFCLLELYIIFDIHFLFHKNKYSVDLTILFLHWVYLFKPNTLPFLLLSHIYKFCFCLPCKCLFCQRFSQSLSFIAIDTCRFSLNNSKYTENSYFHETMFSLFPLDWIFVF